MALLKPVIGITVGDVNGIGVEVILKTFLDTRIFDFCTPVIYGNAKLLSNNRKAMNLPAFNFNLVKEDFKLSFNAINVVNIWEEELLPAYGTTNPGWGKYAFMSIEAAMKDYTAGKIQAIVTAPINKQTIHSETFPFKGHTEYFTQQFPNAESVMMMVGENLRVCMATHHIALGDVKATLTTDLLTKKINLIKNSLIKDFGIDAPRVAVLGLNPHAGDNGLMGDEEEKIILPAIKTARDKGLLIFGPYPADGFFGAKTYKNFDCVLAMYHDQGLIPFKAIEFSSGVNFTAGIPLVRTSPDHGTAFDIAGKGIADESSFREAVFLAVDIYRSRINYAEMTSNPIVRKVIQKERY